MASTPVSAPSANLITALGAGSGVDTKALATNLVEAERAPAKALIDKRIASTNASISGYAALKYVVGQLQTAFAGLKDQSDFQSITPSSSQPQAISASASPSASAGLHSVAVTQLAAPQRNISNAYASSSSALNSGQAFNLAFSLHGASPATSIAVPTATPAGVVAAINSAGLGLSASLLNTGDTNTPIRILVSGKTGAVNDFSLSPLNSSNQALADLNFGAPIASAANAQLSVNSVAINASSNQVVNAIDGTTLTLSALTSGSASLNLVRDVSAVKTRLQAVVTAYNDAQDVLKDVSDPKSQITGYGASLVGNSLVSQLRGQLSAMVVGNSSSPSGSLTALRDIGMRLDKAGKMTLDLTKLDAVLTSDFDRVVTLLSANRENLSSTSNLSAGVAGDAYKKLTALLASSGAISSQNSNASRLLTEHTKSLTKLEARMTSLLERYTQQFAAMDAIVGRSSSLRTSLKSSFEGMMAMYTNK